ncbi:DUF917 domain-containing protein [Marinitenerispora sediminis]|uniref:DUF917 domain-containing protein n=1 Tax=Marinitenerispora sediminis TaxID=1931232 RepID=A0A368T9C3_9ACTN|nr:DUF917 domain-containing protein [Marinitenerispora sediminis]RCV55364.1 DUF917 domain-containing protein [Marinitenerispora sediminis]RCV59155.1 DUF917 domain-containing protein [Marinitenerispora sediminis]RCV59181.1 DUF917 domain-containing protein [Marinitenerispora sediminis]
MLLDETTLPYYARGAAILGAGGGGSTRSGLLAALQAVQELGPVEVVSLDDVPDDALILPTAGLGSPDITLEKIGNPQQGVWLRDAMERELGRPAYAWMAAEVGGNNALKPVVWAAHTGLPLVDADGMGRAYPEVQMISMHLHGVPATPTVLVDERGHHVVFRDMDAQWLERTARALSVAFGGFSVTVDHSLDGATARTATVRGSVSRAVRIGEILSDTSLGDTVDRLAPLGGHVLVTGKIAEVNRRTVGGFARGNVLVDGVAGDRDRLVRVEIQNENLAVLEEGEVLASVPDVITALDSQTGEVIFTEELRYGQRVTLVALPAPDMWRTEAGLALVGPRAFDYDFDYIPVEELVARRKESVS